MDAVNTILFVSGMCMFILGNFWIIYTMATNDAVGLAVFQAICCWIAIYFWAPGKWEVAKDCTITYTLGWICLVAGYALGYRGSGVDLFIKISETLPFI